jgi:hypothetical protein
MSPPLTCFRVLSATWVGVNIVILALSVFGPRDLSGVTLMLSFPGDIIPLFLLMPVLALTGWSESHRLVTLTFGVAAIAVGYAQWFVLGRALARRLLPRLPFQPLVRVVGDVGVVLIFLGLGAVGWAMVRAHEQEEGFRSRAAAVREGMTVEQVRSILGEPREIVEGPQAAQSLACSQAKAFRLTTYWYEHPSLPTRLWKHHFALALCSDAQGRIVGRSTIDID